MISGKWWYHDNAADIIAANLYSVTFIDEKEEVLCWKLRASFCSFLDRTPTLNISIPSSLEPRGWKAEE
ncbi:hypothetical protein MLD38_011306 [Melastoma candidum]|uniref:Uncharacterized protein n=1 Tax=Melastoma candidum TaxID=119954 RepID=A0ACB9RAY0_9MYRT|nr:hypothetical protein MLD38_011306 [Melastoma candidum]